MGKSSESKVSIQKAPKEEQIEKEMQKERGYEVGERYYFFYFIRGGSLRTKQMIRK